MVCKVGHYLNNLKYFGVETEAYDNTLDQTAGSFRQWHFGGDPTRIALAGDDMGGQCFISLSR